jgi:hypothetical protein
MLLEGTLWADALCVSPRHFLQNIPPGTTISNTGSREKKLEGEATMDRNYKHDDEELANMLEDDSPGEDNAGAGDRVKSELPSLAAFDDLIVLAKSPYLPPSPPSDSPRGCPPPPPCALTHISMRGKTSHARSVLHFSMRGKTPHV